jgi:hypothetical protein
MFRRSTYLAVVSFGSRESGKAYWGGRIRTCNFPGNSRAVCQLTYTPSNQKRPPDRSLAGEQRFCNNRARDLARPPIGEPIVINQARIQAVHRHVSQDISAASGGQAFSHWVSNTIRNVP